MTVYTNNMKENIRTEWGFPCGIIFDATFDSANLREVVKTRPNTFQVTMYNDANTDSRTWFHFAVYNVEPNTTIRITVSNMKRQKGLFNAGYRPCVANLGENEECDSATVDWNRVSGNVSHTPTSIEGQYALSFSHKCTSKRVGFAFCFPYSLKKYETFMKNLECYLQDLASDDQQQHPLPNKRVYCHRQEITRSKQGRPIELITISSHMGALQEGQGPEASKDDHQNPSTPGTENQGDLGSSGGIADTSARFLRNKRVVYVSARVHSGETPSSYSLEGLLETLVKSGSPEVEALRDNFVFKIIPVLNPDGVALGHYRGDSEGLNLNRYYDKASPRVCPEIAAALHLIRTYHSEGRLAMYLDMHAHASKQGCFLYGNHQSNIDNQVACVGFASLVSSLCPMLDVSGCNFSKQNMESVDRHGESKAGAGRVSIFRETALVHCYTLECNYWCSKPTFGSTKRTIFGPDTWRSVGRGCLEAVARMFLHNTNCSKELTLIESASRKIFQRVYQTLKHRSCYKGQSSKYEINKPPLGRQLHLPKFKSANVTKQTRAKFPTNSTLQGSSNANVTKQTRAKFPTQGSSNANVTKQTRAKFPTQGSSNAKITSSFGIPAGRTLKINSRSPSLNEISQQILPSRPNTKREKLAMRVFSQYDSSEGRIDKETSTVSESLGQLSFPET